MASAVIGNLRVDLSIDTANFRNGVKDAQDILGRLDRAAGKAILSIGAIGSAAVAAGLAIGTHLVRSSMETIDAQQKLAARIGGTTAAVQTLEHAANLAGVSSETLAKAAGMLNARLGEAAREGAGEAFEALKRLNFTVDELSRMDADTRLAAIADRMKELGFTTQQQADVLRQFGIRGQEMINLFEGGGDQIRAARKDIEDFGVAVSDIDAAQIEQANDAISRLGLISEGIGNQIAIRLAPYIQGIAEGLGNAAREGEGFGDVIDRVMAGAAMVIGNVADQVRLIEKEFARFKLQLAEIADWARTLAKPFAALPLSLGSINPAIGGLIVTSRALTESLPDTSGEIERLRKEFEALAGQPMPSEQLDKWLADWKAKFAATAEETAQMRQQMLGGDGGTGDTVVSDAARAQSEHLAEQQAARLEQLRQSLLTEEQAEQDSYARRMIAIDDFLKARQIGEDEAHSLREAAEAQHQEKLGELQRRQAQDAQRRQQMALNYLQGTLGAITDIIGTEGEKQFAISKALGIAQAIIGTYQGVAASLKLGWPASIAGVAFSLAQGAAAIAQIRQTTSKGNGGGSRGAVASSGGGAAAAAQPSAPPRGAVIRVESASNLFTRDQVRQLIGQMNDVLGDGTQFIFAK